MDKALSNDKSNGHWFEADWLHSKRDALSSIDRLMVRGSQVALKHVIHDMETKTLVIELRRRAIKRWVPCGDKDSRLKILTQPRLCADFGQLHRNAYTIAV